MKLKVLSLKEIAIDAEVHDWGSLQGFLELVALTPPEVQQKPEILAIKDGLGSLTPSHFPTITHALERRISRENTHIAGWFERAAWWLNQNLLPGHIKRIRGIEHIDDVSLKILARAAWYSPQEWKFEMTTRQQSPQSKESATARGRFALFSRFAECVGMQGPLTLSAPPAELGNLADLNECLHSLIATNYSRTLSLGEVLTRSSDLLIASEAERAIGLAFANRGFIDEAFMALGRAESLASVPTRRAHLACLQALLHEKRRYDGSNALTHLERAEGHLANQNSNAPEVKLEYGWILNCRALNEALAYRRGQDTAHAVKALALLKQALQLTRDGTGPGLGYLRYNLIANTSFLFSICGQADRAHKMIEEEFTKVLKVLETEHIEPERLASFRYRVGILLFQLGNAVEARGQLEEALRGLTHPAQWFITERILRALSALEFGAQNIKAASQRSMQGLELSRNGGSSAGVSAHLKHLLLCQVYQGAPNQTLLDEYEARTGRIFNKEEKFESPPAKLPSYIPEIDLEPVPKIDLNRFLQGRGSSKDTHAKQEVLRG